MTEYNKRQELLWGDKASIKTLHTRGYAVEKKNERAKSDELVFNQYTKAYVDKIEYEKAKVKEDINPNHPPKSQKKLT